VFDRVQDENRLRCLQSESGEPLWDYRYKTDFEDMLGYNNGPRCTPVVDDDRVYIYGAEGQLHCVNVIDGSKRWQRDISDEFDVVQNFFGVGSTPLVFGDLLLVMAGGSPPESHKVPPGQLDRVTPDGSALVAIHKHTGQTVYKTGDDLASYASLQLATIDARPTGFMFARSGLWTFEPRAGSMELFVPWRAKKLESVNASTPVIVNREVFITESYEPGGAVFKVGDDKFEAVWQDQPSSRDQSFAAHWMTPIFHAGHLYGCSGQRPREANLRCIEWATGKVRWTKEGTGRISLLYVDGHFLTLSETGEMKIIVADPDAYREVCDLELAFEHRDGGKEDGEGGAGDGGAGEGGAGARLDYPAWAAPGLARGLLYVRGESHLICAELMK
jgi:outer membrane protein assembly factor BamB